jgi:plasmid maintenance system antidote protein VapI
MKERGITLAEVEEVTGIADTVISDICDGFYPINNDCAISLARCFNVPAEFWLKLEANYRRWLAKQTAENLKDLELLTGCIFK